MLNTSDGQITRQISVPNQKMWFFILF